MIGEQAKLNSLYAGTLGATALVAEEAFLGPTKTESLASLGKITAGGELQSTTANGLRIVAGNYGFLIRNDGNHIYFMLTNSGDQYGGYNSLRPLYISNSTGAIGMGNGLTVGGGLASSGVSYLNGGLRVGANGVAIKFMRSGSTVLAGANSSARIFLTDATIKSWYSSYKNGNTAVFISNGDSGACNAHFESAAYASNTQGTGWFVVASSSIASTTNMRINWTIMCW